MSKSEEQKEREALRRSPCPVANALEVVGDRWTLLVVRDLMAGKHRYGELVDSAEGIPTNILAARLKLLMARGLVAREAYQQRPVRYEYRLTPKGETLFPLLSELLRWGLKEIPGTRMPPKSVMKRFRAYFKGKGRGKGSG